MTDLLTRALRVIPSGGQTFSKSRSVWPSNAPSHLVRGYGSHVWDDKKREYIDVTLGLGPIVLGYQDQDVERSVRLAQQDGPIFSLPYQLEVAIAEMLVRWIPCAQPDGMVKFGLSGTDATGAAMRCARACTGRDQVVSVGYHGWAETCPNRVGIPHDPYLIRADHWWDIRAIPYPGEVAAIIVEPEYADDLVGLREYCTTGGIVLIFDEVLTGFRVALGGYQEYSGVIPDLACFSKAMGNGYPISAVVGKREIMQTFESIGYSGTFFGSTPGLAATGAVIRKMRQEPVIEHLWDAGARLRRTFDAEAKSAGIDAQLVGLAPRMVYRFAGDVDVDPIIRDKPAVLPWRTLFAQEMIRAGVLSNFGITACYAHSSEDVERIGEAIRSAFAVLGGVDDPSGALVGAAALSGVRAA